MNSLIKTLNEIVMEWEQDHPVSIEHVQGVLNTLDLRLTYLENENKELREANDYGRGVSAGKLEALGYSEREKKAYLNVVSYSEGHQDAKRLFENNSTK
jgi:hypothetical protein